MALIADLAALPGLVIHAAPSGGDRALARMVGAKGLPTASVIHGLDGVPLGQIVSRKQARRWLNLLFSDTSRSVRLDVLDPAGNVVSELRASSGQVGARGADGSDLGLVRVNTRQHPAEVKLYPPTPSDVRWSLGQDPIGIGRMVPAAGGSIIDLVADGHPVGSVTREGARIELRQDAATPTAVRQLLVVLACACAEPRWMRSPSVTG